MARTLSLRPLVAHRPTVYVVGVLAIVGVRTLPLPSAVRTVAVGLLLGLMVLTYAGERWGDGQEGVARPTSLVPGVAGVALGVAVTVSGRAVGLLFLAGGLLLLNRAMTGGGKSP